MTDEDVMVHPLKDVSVETTVGTYHASSNASGTRIGLWRNDTKEGVSIPPWVLKKLLADMGLAVVSVGTLKRIENMNELTQQFVEAVDRWRKA